MRDGNASGAGLVWHGGAAKAARQCGILPSNRDQAVRHAAHNRNGGRHFCQPPSAPSEGSAGVRQLWRPEGLLLLDPGSPAQASLPRVDPNPKTGSSCFRGPSWTNPLSRRLRPEGHRVRARKNGSSGASSGWSNSKPKLLLIACRWRSDLLPLPSEEGWDFRPDHPFLMNLAPSRSKRKKQRSGLWITGISRITPQSRRLPFCSPAPTSTRCPNLPP